MTNIQEPEGALILRGADDAYYAIPAAEILERYRVPTEEVPALQAALEAGAAEDADTTGHLLGGVMQSGPRAIGGEYVQQKTVSFGGYGSYTLPGYFVEHRFLS